MNATASEFSCSCFLTKKRRATWRRGRKRGYNLKKENLRGKKGRSKCFTRRTRSLRRGLFQSPRQNERRKVLEGTPGWEKIRLSGSGLREIDSKKQVTERGGGLG